MRDTEKMMLQFEYQRSEKRLKYCNKMFEKYSLEKNLLMKTLWESMLSIAKQEMNNLELIIKDFPELKEKIRDDDHGN